MLEREPASIRFVRADSLQALPSNSPSASRMAIMLGGRGGGSARKIKDTLIEIAAHNLGCTLESVEYHDGKRHVRGQPNKRLTWDELIAIAHRKIHKMPPGLSRDSGEVVWKCRPAARARHRQHHSDLPVLFGRCARRVREIDPDTAAPVLRQYVCGQMAA